MKINSLPENIKVPPVPNYMMYITFVAMFFVLLGFIWSPYFGIITELLIITDLILMLSSKKFKCAACLEIGISTYQKGNISRATKYVSKALRYDRDCESAKFLLSLLKGDN